MKTFNCGITKAESMKRSILTVLLSMLLSVFFLCIAGASTIPWEPIPYSHVSRGEKLKDVLEGFGVERGVVMMVSDLITETVNGSFIDYSPDDFFSEICRAYGLIWFYDGASCYVYPQQEIQSKILSFGNASFQDVEKSIRELGISDNRIPIRRLAGKNLIYLIGAPKLIELAETATDILNQAATARMQEQKQENVVRAFMLKHAWATDHKFIISDSEVMVPGVASELKSLLTGDTKPGTADYGTSKQLSRTVDKLRGKGLASIGKTDDSSDQANNSESGDQGGGSRQNGADSFSIQADARLNAVIVRDSKDRMPYYEELIKVLDAPVDLINIEVTIAEVSIGSLRELGVQWRYENSDASGDTYDSGFNADKGFEAGAENLGIGQGLNLAATLSLSAGEYLLTRLHALEEGGNASIQSNPSLLTLDNIQAVIQQTTTFYTKVGGYQDVDLFKVTSGLVLKVRPHLIVGEDPQDPVKIKLLVDVEDGTPDSSVSVDEIPVVSQNSIHTQAVVDSGETLLLGGNIYEKEELKEEKVPLLGDIPLLGYLFKYENKNVQRLERIFMIRPTLYRKGMLADKKSMINISELVVQ